MNIKVKVKVPNLVVIFNISYCNFQYIFIYCDGTSVILVLTSQNVKGFFSLMKKCVNFLC